MIGAQVLNISKQDYDPQGASVNILIAEERINPDSIDKSCNRGIPFFNSESLSEEEKNKLTDTETVHAHLDKSHITVHTFPEYHPDNSISTFRVDIDIANIPINNIFRIFFIGIPSLLILYLYKNLLSNKIKKYA